MRRRPDYAGKRHFPPPLGRGNNLSGRRLLTAGVLAMAGVAILNLAPMMQRLAVTRVEIRGARYAEVASAVELVIEQLRRPRFGILSQSFSPFFNRRQIEKKLRQQYPFANWAVDQRWLDGLRITVEERRAKFVLISGNGTYYIDQQGTAFARLAGSNVEPTHLTEPTALLRHEAVADRLPVVTDELGRRVVLGQAVVPASLVTFLLEVAAGFDSGQYPLTTVVTGYRIDMERYWLAAETARGFLIIFGSDQPAADQFAKLTAVLEQGAAERESLEYLDLRFGQKVFVK